MMIVGILVTFAGYTVTSYGYVLIRGWNIPFRAWVSPLNPYLWPQGDPGTVPDGQIFPSQANDTSGQTAGGQLGSTLAGAIPGLVNAANSVAANTPKPNTTLGNRVGTSSQRQP